MPLGFGKPGRFEHFVSLVQLVLKKSHIFVLVNGVVNLHFALIYLFYVYMNILFTISNLI